MGRLPVPGIMECWNSGILGFGNLVEWGYWLKTITRKIQKLDIYIYILSHYSIIPIVSEANYVPP
jgi:hypothetical protein